MAAAKPPSALERWEEIASRLAGREVAVFLDYDGTLTPIVERPEEAVLAEETRGVVRRLAAATPVVVVSGRDRRDVAARLGLDGLFYAGSHGFDIAGPSGELAHRVGDDVPPLIEAAARRLEADLAGIEGALVEPKRYTVAVHYRLVADTDLPRVEAVVDRVVARHPELQKTGGKKVFEIRPRLDWDKGKALLFLLASLGLDRQDVAAVYLGDDTTDEDAFRALAARERGEGIGIVVLDHPRPTAATYSLADPGEVRNWLGRLAERLEGRRTARARHLTPRCG